MHRRHVMHQYTSNNPEDVQVEDVIFSTYDACTQPDKEGPFKGKPFKAQVQLVLVVLMLAPCWCLLPAHIPTCSASASLQVFCTHCWSEGSGTQTLGSTADGPVPGCSSS